MSHPLLRASNVWSRRAKSPQRRTSAKRRRLRLFESLEQRIVFASFLASSFAELRSYAGVSDSTVTMAAGVYWIEGDRPDATYLNLTGNNSTFDFSQAELRIDTRNIAGYRDESGSNADFDVMQISGDNLIVNGLKLYGQDVDLDTDPDARRYPNKAANYLRISGSNIELTDAHIVTAGSNPYGYGDAFGKGSPPAGRDLPPGEGGVAYIGHNKTSGVLLDGWGENAKIDGLDLDMFTYGQGVYVQGYNDVEIRNSSVTGELFSSNDVINHPLYQEYGFTAWGTEMIPDIMISGSEDAIRYYGDGSSLPWSEGLILDNVEVNNMREAFALTAARGEVIVNNVSAYGNESGFGIGADAVITNSRGDITNGPLIQITRDYANNITAEIELVGDVPQIGRDWDVAYIFGTNNEFTLTSDIDPELLSDEVAVRVGQRYNGWRAQERDLDDVNLPTDGIVLNNLTGQISVLGANTDGVTGFSSVGTVNGGDGNLYDGITLVLSGTRMTARDTQALGNNGSAAQGTLASNGSIVFDGGTLELNPGVSITDEQLTITGDGVDGKGALYSDGLTSSGTRFGSSNNSDESTIVLDGDASIGVGIAGNQMLVGRIQGTGDLTKLGSGMLSVEKSSTLSGNLIIAEGSIVARGGVVNNSVSVASGASLSAIGNTLSSASGIAQIDGSLDLNQRTSNGGISHTIGSLSGTGQITSSNPTAGSGGTLTLAGANGSATYTGTIDGLVNIAVSGAVTQSLNGTMTHTGTTTVSAGTLLINGTHTGGGQYSVNNDGTLGGNGSIDSAVVVNSGGHLSPGASAGTLSVNDVTLSSGAFFEVEIGGTDAESEYDQLIANSAMLGGALSISMLESGVTAFQPSPTDTFTIVVSSTSLSGMFENVASGQRLETLGGEGTFLVTYAGNSVLLSDFEATLLDFGDAPASYSTAGYPTLRANDGARHAAVGPRLGPSRDVESDGAPTAAADGDGSDDDGALFGGIAVNSSVAAVNIELAGASEAKVDAWIDFNRDGVWSPSEKIIDDALIDQSMQTINYSVPSGLTTGDTYARVRLSSAGGLSPNGFAPDGEVEDYVVSINEPPMVESIVINDDDSQRSSVDSVQITFDQVVDINDVGGDPFAFVHDSGDVVTALPVIDHSSGKTVVNFTFDPDGLRVTSFGSLENGDYQLTIDASRVTHLGVELDGDGDGSAGDDHVMSAVDGLFRKYGDHNGDDAVGLQDFAAFRQTFGKSQGASGYLDGFDSDGDNSIGLTDFAAFRQSFGS